MNVGAFEVAGELGRGGSAVVYRARAANGDEVALKLLRTLDEPARSRFVREVRLLRDLTDAPGFVPLIAVGEHGGAPWVAMPLLEGGTLRARLRHGPLAVDEALALVLALARAMAVAHARGIVHRDLKPENVLFTREGEPRIADLGLAKHFRRDVPGASASAALSSGGEFCGTAGYAPPEQMRDASSAGAPADVFALGAILYECLAGTAPFDGRSVLETIERTEGGRFTPVHELRAGVPPWVARVLARALARTEEDRHRDAGALARALEAEGREGARAGVKRVAVVLVALAAGAALVVAEAREKGLAGDAAVIASTSLVAAPAPASASASATATATSADVVDAAADAAALLAEARRAADRSSWEARAIAAADRAVAADPRSILALEHRARLRLRLRDPALAVEDATRVLASAPDSVDALVVRALGFIALGRVPEGKVDARRAVALAPGRKDCILAAAKADHLSEERGGAALRLIPLGEKVAEEWARFTETRDPIPLEATPTRSAAEPPRGDARAWIARAEELLEARDLVGTCVAALRAIELSPDGSRHRRARIRARLALGDAAGALADADLSVATDRKSSDAWFARALVREARGDVEGALADATAALERKPEHVRALALRATALVTLGRLDEAERDLVRACAKNDPSALIARARLRVARGDPKSALDDLDLALEKRPDDAPALLERARIHGSLGNAREAARDHARATLLAKERP